MTFAGYIARTTRMRCMCWQVTPWSTRADAACAWWPEPETDDADWRAVAYECAATRPCLSPVDSYALFGRACWEMCPGPQSSCISVHAVARSPGAHI